MSDDPLLQPYQLKTLRLRNRVMSTAHEPSYAEDGLPKERYRLYHVEKARGGIAMTMTAGSAIVSTDSPVAFGNLHAFRDEIVPWMRALTEECHEHGAAVMIQLTHLGRRGSGAQGHWLPVLSASPVREAAHRAFPKEAEDWDLDRIAGDYAAAAERMQAAGLDGIEIEAYGHLLDSFWSPATNQREDAFGGSLDNRLRFTHKVLDEIRGRVGHDFIVGIRMVADEDWDRGLSREDGVEIAQRLARSGKVDFLNLIRGHVDTDAALTDVIPIGGMRSAPHLDFAGEVREVTRFPVFHAARINDVATARHAIATGKLDMVGMTRAHIADPHIIAKVQAGREHEIRPCVGATYCLDRIYEGRDALCIHNASTGREATMPHVIERTADPARRIVVVGAGPAGLEAARVAAERGHEVSVYEAAPHAGGQLRIAARAQRRAELAGIVDWRLERLDALGATVHFNRYLEAGDVLALDPDVVLVATGGLPDTGCIDSGEAHVTTSWDIVSGVVEPAAEVLLYDDNGAHPGMQAAERIARAGSRLEVVSPERFFAPELGGMNHVPYARAFAECGVRVTISTRVRSVERAGNRLAVTLCNDFADTTETREVDQVVVEHGTRPLDELYYALKPHSRNLGAVDYDALLAVEPQSLVRNMESSFQLFRIGDAVTSRNVHAAVYDGLRFARVL